MQKTHRLWAISDIHIDSPDNHQLLLGLDDHAYQDDLLIIAGDATDDLALLRGFLATVRGKFQQVAFVPGNHELWLRNGNFEHSIDKFEAILAACDECGVTTRPMRFGGADSAVWIVPLFSWYEGPDEDDESLFVPKGGVTDKTHEMWRDYFLTRWPKGLEQTPADYFLALNQTDSRPHDVPVVSFSHFLPREELMFRKPGDHQHRHLTTKDPHPEFNFSRVAGTWKLDRQLRELGSRVHIYGHQHRNRCRMIDDVIYLSHCLGYPGERREGYLADNAEHPRLIWQSDSGFTV